MVFTNIYLILKYVKYVLLNDLTGYVTSSLHEPILNAKLIFGMNDTYTFTDSLGRFEKPLPPGEYVITVRNAIFIMYSNT
jgi:hypothetical protein